MSGPIPGTNIFLITNETPEACSQCKRVEELRPYGKGGAKLCFGCAMKSENAATVQANFGRLLDGKKLE